MRLLLINPNTSVHITERVAGSVRSALGAGHHLSALTAEAGPAVVRSAPDLRQAEASALAMARAHAAGHDAILLGISLDGAAARLRAVHPHLPVVGMTEAALATACLRTERIGLLTLGAALLPLYRQRVAQIGLASRVVAYEAPASSGAFSARAARVDADVLALLVAACARLHTSGAQSVVLAGAVLCGYAQALAERCGLFVFDGADCAARQIRVLLASGGTGVGPTGG